MLEFCCLSITQQSNITLSFYLTFILVSKSKNDCIEVELYLTTHNCTYQHLTAFTANFVLVAKIRQLSLKHLI